VPEALETLAQEEAGRLIDQEAATREAIRRVEQSGIVFLDEIDKITGREGVHGPGPISAAHARLLDVGHSHGTFLTSEFGFQLAQRHARGLRGVALALGFGLPLAWLVVGVAHWQLALAAAVCCIMGLLVERWLFFAEAKHTVRLYHGDPRT